MSSARQKLSPEITLLHKVADAAEIARAQQELGGGGGGGPRKWLVVRILDGETDEQAQSRTFALHPWVDALSPAARQGLLVIMVRRVTDPPAADIVSA